MTTSIIATRTGPIVFGASRLRPVSVLAPGVYICEPGCDLNGNRVDIMFSIALGPARLAHDWQDLLWAIETGCLRE